MYYELSDEELKKIKEIEEITFTNYSRKDKLIPIENLIVMLEDLLYFYNSKDEELRDKENYCEEYHKERYRDEYDLYGVSPRDFY